MAWVRLSLRRLRDDRPATVGLVVLVLVTAFLAAASPRVLASLADDAVQSSVAAAPPAARNIALIQHLLVAPGPADDPLANVRAAGLEREQTFPPAVRRLIAERSAAVESGRFRVNKQTTDPAFVRFRVQEGIDPYIRYVEGVAPTTTVTTRDDVGPEQVDGVPVYEVGVARATADAFGLAVGDEVQLAGDPGDPLVGRNGNSLYAYAKIAGIYEVPDPEADFWLDDFTLIHPVIRALSSEVQLLDASLLVADGTHERLATETAADGRSLRYTWRSFLDVSRLTDRSLDATIVAFRRLQVRYPSANVTPANDTALRTGMLPLLEGHRARWNAAVSIVAVMALGPALVAVATLALIAVLAASRRRSTMALARSRGASVGQVIRPVLVEGLLLALPAAAIALVLAVLVVQAGRLSAALAMASAVVVVAVAVVVATVLGVARGFGGGDRDGAARVVRRPSARRLLFEALLVVAAVAGALLLRDRGVGAVTAAAADADATPAFDPLIAAVPALVGIAAGIVVLRLYPVPLAAVAWIARRRRGLVGMLAARRAREGGAASAVLLVLLATATLGAFAVTALDHLDRGADVAAWQEVGAAYRLQQAAGPLPRQVDTTALPGVEASSGVFAALIPIGLSGPQVMLTIPEAAALEHVNAGTPAAPAFPPGFATPAPGPIPAIVSTSLTESPRGVQVGETFTLSVEGYNLTYLAVEARDAFPGVPLGRHFVVVAREAFVAQAPPARIVPVYALVRAAPEAGPALEEAVASQAPTVLVASQADRAQALRDQPVTNAVRALILVAALVTALYAALGVAAALALAGVARTREVAHLRTLGLTGRQQVLLTVAEHGPTTLAAFLIGAALGVGLFVLLRPGLGLAALVGSPVDVPVVLEPLPMLLILLAMTVVVGVGLLLGVALQRRVAPTAALRGRFE